MLPGLIYLSAEVNAYSLFERKTRHLGVQAAVPPHGPARAPRAGHGSCRMGKAQRTQVSLSASESPPQPCCGLFGEGDTEARRKGQ